jgi:chromosome segregation ATPase
MSPHVAAEIDGFLSRRYRHYKEDVEAVLENPRLSDWLRGAYQILGGWVAAGENPQDFAALDRIRADFNSAAPAFSRLIAAGKTATGKFTQADRMLAETQAKLAKAERARAAAQEEAACQATELREVRRQLRQCERQIERLKTASRTPGGMAKDDGNKAGAGLQVAATPVK